MFYSAIFVKQIVKIFCYRCNFDYIAISSINNQGYKEPKFIYCGSVVPPVYISTYPKLEIIFHSDFTKDANGFIGHYEFLGKSMYCFSTVLNKIYFYCVY